MYFVGLKKRTNKERAARFHWVDAMLWLDDISPAAGANKPPENAALLEENKVLKAQNELLRELVDVLKAKNKD